MKNIALLIFAVILTGCAGYTPQIATSGSVLGGRHTYGDAPQHFKTGFFEGGWYGPGSTPADSLRTRSTGYKLYGAGINGTHHQHTMMPGFDDPLPR